MIRFQRHDALHPEKETTLAFDFSPLLVFAVGYFVARSLLSALAQSVGTGHGDT